MPNDAKQPPYIPESKTINFAARHNARRYAVQAMYQWQLATTPLHELENEFLRHHINKQFDLAYFQEIIHGIPHYQQEIDQAMQPFLERNLQEIDPVELAVLRLAIYELIKRPDIPYRVIINEALQLTKKFGSIEGYKFVNGVLDKVAKIKRAEEISAKNTGR
ncbi:MAG: hypothetical protein A3F42_04235 [Gammaproteobacteria bacterium RIFCSPHIGHO2_12_FULL_37_34]|nr:MAG: hypothetical protein A3F42_04235 [Gammaproteobacteria bacterium RIFCSPHIGHO2_12_FULL_37_34]